MQVKQNLTNQQKLEQLKKGCRFKVEGDYPSTVYTTCKGFDVEVSKNGKPLGTLVRSPHKNIALVEVTLWRVKNTFPIDLSLVEIL